MTERLASLSTALYKGRRHGSGQKTGSSNLFSLSNVTRNRAYAKQSLQIDENFAQKQCGEFELRAYQTTHGSKESILSVIICCK